MIQAFLTESAKQNGCETSKRVDSFKFTANYSVRLCQLLLFTTSLSALPNQQPSLTVNFKNTISMKNSRSNNPQSHYGKQTNKRKANCLSITCTKTCIHSPAAEETLSSFPSAFQTGVSPTDNATDETPQSVTSFYMQ